MALRPFDRHKFGDRLREARGARSTTDVAEALGIDQSLYSKYENGKREMYVRHVESFCVLCGVAVVWLITGDQKRQRVARRKRKTAERAA